MRAPCWPLSASPGLDRDTRYQLVSKTDTDVVYRTVLDKRIEVTRHYVVSPDKGAARTPT
jgi:YidC/Oxa1 family membrane protein insertase